MWGLTVFSCLSTFCQPSPGRGVWKWGEMGDLCGPAFSTELETNMMPQKGQELGGQGSSPERHFLAV